MNFVEELKWRGLLYDIMPGTEELLAKEKVTGYIGFDPTADSLHIGSLVPIILLVHFQHYGHKPIALVGGATGMIGDPTGKTEERKFLTKDILDYNLECIKKQLSKFLDFSKGIASAEIVNNYDWYKEMSLLEFLREAGKHITVNYMMAKDSVKNRLETGISFTEFSYQLIQGYDFYWLYKNKNCKLQMGGSDQWGNITTGVELIRRKINGEAFALTAPLIQRSDGKKFGKSEEGNIWLDPEKTSPYKFYQYWLNVSDEDAEKYIKIFTFLSREEIDALIELHKVQPEKRILQKKLAEELTVWVHSKEDLEKSIKASEILFGNATLETLKSVDEQTLLNVFDGIPVYELSYEEIKNDIEIIDLLVTKCQIFPSKGEVRRTIQGGGLSVNKEKVLSPEIKISKENLLNNRYILIQKGKKNYYLIKFI